MAEIKNNFNIADGLTTLPIIIGGGVGPMAGVVLHTHIINETSFARKDQDHLSVIHISQSKYIPDRTEFLLGRQECCPAEGMMNAIISALGDIEYPAVLGVPCNTFHADVIFSKFIQLLQTQYPNIICLSLIDALIADIITHTTLCKVGVLSTTGTQKTGIYKKALHSAGLQHISLEGDAQDLVHQSIYHPEWGIKTLNQASPQSIEIIYNAIEVLKKQGAEAIVLGCTELPIVIEELKDIPVFDPMKSFAKQLIDRAVNHY